MVDGLGKAFLEEIEGDERLGCVANGTFAQISRAGELSTSHELDAVSIDGANPQRARREGVSLSSVHAAWPPATAKRSGTRPVNACATCRSRPIGS